MSRLPQADYRIRTVPYDRMASSLRGQPLITGVLEQFTTERMAITRYHDAYLDALASEGRQSRDGSL